jgi:hypothetical protein
MGEVEKRLGKLAEEINAEHRACEAALRSGLRHAVRAGELLTEAKGQVKHGEWGTWLSANFGGSERTAQAYMRVFREMPKLEGVNPQRVTDLSFRGALRELSASAPPQKERSAEEEHTRRSILQRFDRYLEVTETLVAIRDSGAWNAKGTVEYERTLMVSADVAKNLGKKAIVQHGVDLNDNGRYDFKAAGKSELDPSLPQEATIPATCGVINPK